MPLVTTTDRAIPSVAIVRQGLTDATIAVVTAVCRARPALMTPPDTPILGEKVIGIVSLAGAAGFSMFLGMPRRTAEVFAARFAGFSIAFGSPEMADAIGELANMVAGELKSRLERQGIATNLSVPVTLRGHDLNAASSPWHPLAPCSFTTAAGSFVAGLCAKL